ncbi:hypothetical protein KY290_018529 [Solanum tuberosum]|uniref:Retroviral polymerase SH3-like domain-containing protein n=1 Tax=Solanum tuberosum TaxID=4113 RepID=A0ABQ7VG86_SOLTU|nr:hypothetical protein KY289_017650 [Solanum tuberosum]KAH0762456.1 hypothetical protein KY290_018529 [Solanum tuberosum]
MGYAETQKGYRVLDLESNSFQVSRDVTFIEDQFPFKTSLTPQHFEATDSSWLQTFGANEHVHLPHADTGDILHDTDTRDIMHDIPNEATDPLAAEEDSIPNEALTDEASSEATHVVVTTAPPHARPNRSIRPPIWHKDYLVPKSSKLAHKDIPYPITNYATYSKSVLPINPS